MHYPRIIRFALVLTLSLCVQSLRAQATNPAPPMAKWTDHRPLSQLMFDDPKPGQSIADWQTQTLTRVAATIAIAKSMHAQGVVIWNAEGNAFAYVGDPSQCPLAMDAILDQIAKKFIEADLKFGFCIRGTIATKSGGGIDQGLPLLAHNTLVMKVQYCQKRWGKTCCLFYVDSCNGQADGNGPWNWSIWSQVMKRCPGILLIPEYRLWNSEGYCAPYQALQFMKPEDVIGTPAKARETVPGAATVICVATSSNRPVNPKAAHGALVTALKAGDIGMYLGWSRSTEAAELLDCYREAGIAGF